MKNKKYTIVGIIVFVSAIVALSGCVSDSGSNNGYPSVKGDYKDIKMANTPSPHLLSDGSSYMVGGLLQNSGNKNYSNVLLRINGVDKTGKVLSSKETMITNMPAGATGDYQVFLDVPSGGEEIVGVDLEVVSANQS